MEVAGRRYLWWYKKLEPSLQRVSRICCYINLSWLISQKFSLSAKFVLLCFNIRVLQIFRIRTAIYTLGHDIFHYLQSSLKYYLEVRNWVTDSLSSNISCHIQAKSMYQYLIYIAEYITFGSSSSHCKDRKPGKHIILDATSLQSTEVNDLIQLN